MAQKMALITNELLAEILSRQQSPCLSLYQPTHRRHPENQQDPVRFRNLVKEMEASLRQKYPAVEIQPLLAPFEALAHDRDFWNHTLDGLAVLGGPGQFRVFKLQRPIVELVVVADSFHTKPLRRRPQSHGGDTSGGAGVGVVSTGGDPHHGVLPVATGFPGGRQATTAWRHAAGGGSERGRCAAQ